MRAVKETHRNHVRGWLVATVVAGCVALPAGSQTFDHGKLRVEHPWSPPTAAGRPVGVAYLSITNTGTAPEALLQVSTPVAEEVQIHQTTMSGGMAHMRPLEEVAIGPGKTVKIEPNGIHLMLMGLKQELVAGTAVPLTLRFRNAGAVVVQLKIEERKP